MVEKYKTYFIVGVICFLLGLGVPFLSGRGQLQSLRIRAEQVSADYIRVRAELQSSQKQLADLKATIGAAGKTASDAAKATNGIEKSNREIRESINTAIREIESSGDEFNDARRILSEVQRRGGGKD
jgi:septal ring factor EnvC (AmiA/AmiB activator)